MHTPIPAPPARRRVSTRRHAVGALAVLSAIALAACSSDGTSGTPATSGPDATSTPSGSAPGGSDERRTFTAADGTEVDYVIVVPPGRAPGEAGRVLFAFPPGGQDIDLTEEIVRDKWEAEALARGYVVVSPAAPSTGLWYTDASAAIVPELLDEIAAQYPPEGGRFDLAGVSNGGLSAFEAALEHPERFRSLVVFPGYSPDGADDPRLGRLAGIGVAMYVGGEDGGWLEASRTTAGILQGLGITVDLHEVPGQGHILGGILSGATLYDAIERVRG